MQPAILPAETGLAETGPAETGLAETGLAETGLAAALARINALEAELTESRETLQAIRKGDIDAIVVDDADGAPRVYTLETADRPYRHLIEQMQEGALTLGADGTVLYCNRRVGELLGLPQEQVLGQDLGRFIAPAAAAAFATLLAQAGEAGARAELTLRRTDGVEVPVAASLSALHDHEATLLCGVLSDLSLHHARLREADATNGRLRGEIDGREQAEAALRQAQKMQAIGQLSGGIAHDFNNMLQGFASGTELMRRRLEQNRPAEAMRYVEAVMKGIDRASALTHRLLAFSRRQALLTRPVDPRQVVAESALLMRQTVGPEITVRLDLGEDPRHMMCDRNQFEAALLNLAINARDAMMPAGGTLSLATARVSLAEADLVGFSGARPGEYIRVSVSDTGMGMSQEVMERAFEPFYTTKPTGQGTGLGLSQVYGFVAQSDGMLRVVSAPGEGATFHIHLPCATATAADGQMAEAQEATPLATPTLAAPPLAAPLLAAPPLAAPPLAATPPRALLVDDEPEVRAALAEALRDLGWQVDQAATGQQALDVLHAGPAPAIMVADIGLPGGMNGCQLAEAAREILPRLPILLITGYAGSALAPGATLPPGAELLHKPFTLGVLAGRVSKLTAVSVEYAIQP